MVRVHIFISGLVQGVGFRVAVRDKMEEWGILGWVENLADGRVEAVFEGDKEQIEKMVEWCRKGPPLARVEKVDVLYYRT